MCGRFTQSANPAAVAEALGIAESALPRLTPRYNIAPTQQVLTAGRNATGAMAVGFMKWGLVPSWSHDDKGGARLINARADGVATKPSFRTAFKKRRCLIPVSGFFEWQTTGKAKQPYHFRRCDGKPFLFAGLWESWGDTAAPLLTTCLITTDANGTVSPFHDRMPVILSQEFADVWLDQATPADRLQELLSPAAEDLLEAVAVSKLVNSPKNDRTECIDQSRGPNN